MDVRFFLDAEAFLTEAGPLLLEDEARHNLILGIAGTLVAAPDRYPEKRFWVASDGGEPVAAALRTPPYNLVVARPRDDTGLDALAGAIEEDLPGVAGARPEGGRVRTSLGTRPRDRAARHSRDGRLRPRASPAAADASASSSPTSPTRRRTPSTSESATSASASRRRSPSSAARRASAASSQRPCLP